MLGSTFLENLLRKRNAVTVNEHLHKKEDYYRTVCYGIKLNPLVYISENLCSKYEYNL